MFSCLRRIKNPSVRRFAGTSVLLLLTFAVFCGRYCRDLFATDLPGGWDGVGHFQVARLYSSAIFPRVSGWLPEYFTGMPFPDFYPPLFYVIFSLLDRLGLPQHGAFLGFNLLLLMAIVILIQALTYRAARSHLAAALAGFLTIIHIAQASLWDAFNGLTLQSTFLVGLSTQPLGAVFCLLFFVLWKPQPKISRRGLLAAICLAAVPLSNVHGIWPLLCWVLGALLVSLLQPQTSSNVAVSGKYLLSIGILAVGLSAFWTLPMVARLDFMPTRALLFHNKGTLFLRLGLGLAAVSVFFLLSSRRSMSGFLHTIYAALYSLSIFVIIPWSDLPGFQDAAMQQNRAIPMILLLASIPSGILMARILCGPLHAALKLLSCTAIAAVATLSFDYAKLLQSKHELLDLFRSLHIELVSRYPAQPSEQSLGSYRAMIEASTQLDPHYRILVQVGEMPDFAAQGSLFGFTDRFGLQAHLGAYGGQSLTTVFRESSISVAGTFALRNMLSPQPDSLRSFVDTKIDDHMLQGSSWEFQKRLLCHYNVGYLALRDLSVLPDGATTTDLVLLAQSPPWSLLALKNPCPRAQLLNRRPVLSFARWNVKTRPAGDLDFMSLGEHHLLRGDFSVTYALARQTFVDREPDIRQFGGLLLVDYRYEDVDAAFRQIEEFSRQAPVAFLKSSDSLSILLQELAKTRSTLFGFSEVSLHMESSSSGIVEKKNLLIDQLQQHFHTWLPVSGEAQQLTLAGDRHTLRLRSNPQTELGTPVLLRQSFFPNWDQGHPVYLVAPSFQLLFMTDKETTITFGQTPLQSLTLLGTLLTLLLYGSLWLRRT